jgi:hypothetical protein
MKTRLEIFHELCAHIQETNKNFLNEPKIKETDEYISFSLQVVSHNSDNLPALRLHVKEKGYKELLTVQQHGWDSIVSEAYDRYMTVLYNKIKNKIAVSYFDVGFRWAQSKLRYYPLKRNHHIVTLSNTLHIIIPQSRNFTGGVRAYKGEIVDKELIKILCDIPYEPCDLFNITYRGLIGTKTPAEAIEKQHGVKIPRAIQQRFKNDEMIQMCRLFEEKDFNKICQVLATIPIVDKEKEKVYIYEKPMFVSIMSKIWLNTDIGEGNNNYTDFGLIRDFMHECDKLKIKPSMKMKSRARLETEHRRNTRLIMAKGTPEIKPDECYKDLLVGLPYKYEFIDKKERLIAETVEQDHCVATYASKINSGGCGIYSIIYEGQRWTLELNKHLHSDAFVIAQCRGIRNQDAPAELKTAISQLPNILRDSYRTSQHLQGGQAFYEELPF